MQIRTILCPTDFSEPADHALAEAAGLARQFGARLILAHVIEPVPMLPSPQVGTVPAFDVGAYSALMRETATKHLQERIEAWRADGVEIVDRLGEGLVADTICDLATSEHVDLIVIATHGRSGWKRLIFGSVADKIVRHAACPVLTIKEPRHPE